MMNRVLALACIASVAMGVVACSKEKPQEPTSTASSTTTETATVNSPSSQSFASSPSAESSSAEVPDAVTQTVEYVTDSGQKVLVGQAFAEALHQHEANWGKPTMVREHDGRWLAEFRDGQRITYSWETGAFPLQGMINQLWLEHGGMTGQLGLPVAAEHEIEGGWEQSFEHGVIKWVKNPEGQYEAVVEGA